MSVENLPVGALGQEDNQLKSARHKIPETQPSSYRLSHASAPDTEDSTNEILSQVSSYFTARASPSSQDESEDIFTCRTYNSSINEAEEALWKAQSRQSSLSVQKSKSSPIELPEPSATIHLPVKAPENILSSSQASPLSSQVQLILDKLLPIPGSFPADTSDGNIRRNQLVL